MAVQKEPIDGGIEEWKDVSFDYGVYSGRCANCKLFSGPWHLNQPYKFCPYCGHQMIWRTKHGKIVL